MEKVVLYEDALTIIDCILKMQNILLKDKEGKINLPEKTKNALMISTKELMKAGFGIEDK